MARKRKSKERTPRREPVRDEFARNILVELNQGLVPWFLYHFGGRPVRAIARLDDDALGIAQMALIRTAELWEPSKGTFANYAPHWMWGYILRDYQRERQWVNLLPLSQARSVGRIWPDFELVDNRLDTEGILEPHLEKLSPRSRVVIELRYGIGQDRPQTLKEVGLAIGVTRERVRQIEARAIRRLSDSFAGIDEPAVDERPSAAKEPSAVDRFFLRNPEEQGRDRY